jgi:hypothetical protein
LVDHTTCDSLHLFQDEFTGESDRPRLSVENWDLMHPLSKHEASMRIALSTIDGSYLSTATAEQSVLIAQSTD